MRARPAKVEKNDIPIQIEVQTLLLNTWEIFESRSLQLFLYDCYQGF